eukprot:354843_1
MALFNKVSVFGGHGGDIWATDTFSFTSPINSLLNNGNYTLSQILNEDEVLQEVKNYNLKLIEFLSTETIVSELVGFISTPIDVNSTKEKQIKYPYMACEIFCCEVGTEPFSVYMLKNRGRQRLERHTVHVSS